MDPVLYIPGYIWQWLPAALWLLLYVLFKALFQRGASSENSLYSNDSLISCFLAFVVFTTEMCVQILIKRWASLCCLFPLTVPLDWTPANRAIYFPLPSFSFPAKINSKIFWFAVTQACWFLSSFEKRVVTVTAELGIQYFQLCVWLEMFDFYRRDWVYIQTKYSWHCTDRLLNMKVMKISYRLCYFLNFWV